MSNDMAKSLELQQLTHPKRPTPRQRASVFKTRIGTAPPPARKIYRDDTPRSVSAIPEYVRMVIGIPGKPLFPSLGTDAMHCRTRAVPREVLDNWLKAQAPTAP